MGMIKVKSQLGDMGMEIPSHTLEALELYLIHGYHPGGFLSSVLAGDFFRAVSTADTANRQMLWVIGRWISHEAPHGSWGSYDAIDNWCANFKNCRTSYVDQLEKTHIVDILKEQQ
jgi:hypothetical protein